MDKIKNLHGVSGFIFFVLALSYVVMVLALRNGFMADFFLVIMRILDIPFAFVSLLYGGSTLAMQVGANKEEDASSSWLLIIFLLCLILFGAVVFVNFAFPSQL